MKKLVLSLVVVLVSMFSMNAEQARVIENRQLYYNNGTYAYHKVALDNGVTLQDAGWEPVLRQMQKGDLIEYQLGAGYNIISLVNVTREYSQDMNGNYIRNKHFDWSDGKYHYGTHVAGNGAYGYQQCGGYYNGGYNGYSGYNRPVNGNVHVNFGGGKHFGGHVDVNIGRVIDGVVNTVNYVKNKRDYEKQMNNNQYTTERRSNVSSTSTRRTTTSRPSDYTPDGRKVVGVYHVGHPSSTF